MSSSNTFSSNNSFVLSVPEGLRTLTFECEKAVIKPREILTEWPEGLEINFDETDKIIFKIKDEEFTFVKESQN